MWGGEFFVADFVEAERIAHLAYVPMPGGAKAIREPWRMAAVYLQQAFGDEFVNLDLPFVKDLEQRDWPTLRSMVATRTNCPETSSMGRLFDAVSSLLGVRSAGELRRPGGDRIGSDGRAQLRTGLRIQIQTGKSEKMLI